jgi:hypothetical protein
VVAAVVFSLRPKLLLDSLLHMLELILLELVLLELVLLELVLLELVLLELVLLELVLQPQFRQEVRCLDQVEEEEAENRIQTHQKKTHQTPSVSTLESGFKQKLWVLIWRLLNYWHAP